MVRDPRAPLQTRNWRFAGQSLWLLVAAVFLCAALNSGLNTNLNVGVSLATVKATRLHDQDGSRIYNEAAIAICLIGLLAALTRPESFRRALRILWSPIAWAVAYQAIIAWHFWSEDNTWDMARLCGAWLLLVVAMAASAPMTMERYVPKMLIVFRMLLWLSVVIGVALPDHGWQHDYGEGFIPGLSERFMGIGGHPNGMGAIAGMAIILELDAFLGGRAKRWFSFAHLALATILLLLTQSKTSLVACALCVVYLLYSRRNRLLPGPVRVVAVTTTVVLASLVAWYYLLADWVAYNERNLGDLTGRLSVWQYLWNVGLEQPWFGYGKSLWSQLDMSQSFQYKWAAGNAHNQLLNSFVMAGAVGVVCLVGYVIALFCQKRHIPPQYRTVFAACLLFLIIRSFAEAGFEPGDMTATGHLQTVLIGFCFCRKAPQWIAARRRVPVRPWPKATTFQTVQERVRRRFPVPPARKPILG